MTDFVGEHRLTFVIEPEHAALLVIDMQYASACRDTGLGKLLADSDRAQEGEYRFSRIERLVIPNTQRLLTFCRGAGIPCIFICLGSKAPDSTDIVVHLRELEDAIGNRVGTRTFEILDDLTPLDSEPVPVKTSFSAFTSSGIDALLQTLGIQTVIAVGVSTSQCVDLTARDASDRGYQCVIVEDAVAEDREDHHDASLAQFARSFGAVLTTDALLAMLEGRIPALGNEPDAGVAG